MKIIILNDPLHPMKVKKIEYFKLNEDTNEKEYVSNETKATHIGVFYGDDGYECKNISTDEPCEFSVSFKIFNNDNEIIDWYISKASLETTRIYSEKDLIRLEGCDDEVVEIELDKLKKMVCDVFETNVDEFLEEYTYDDVNTIKEYMYN